MCLLGIALVAACSTPEDGEQTGQSSNLVEGRLGDGTLSNPLSAATDWMVNNLELIDNTPTLMFVDYISRNWEVDAIGNMAREIAEQREPWGLSLLLWRLIDPEFPAGQTFPQPAGTQELLSAALYCDLHPLTPQFNFVIDEFVNEGGYMASHAGIALQWVSENDCEYPALQEKVDYVKSVLLHQIESAATIDDLALETAAVLIYLDGTDQISEAFIRRVKTAQNDDGGWATYTPGDASNWHPTIFGLWILLAHEQGAGAGVHMTP